MFVNFGYPGALPGSGMPTTLALGEEGGGQPGFPVMPPGLNLSPTTLAMGEEGGGLPTGGYPGFFMPGFSTPGFGTAPTTLALGEEGGGFPGSFPGFGTPALGGGFAGTPTTLAFGEEGGSFL